MILVYIVALLFLASFLGQYAQKKGDFNKYNLKKVNIVLILFIIIFILLFYILFNPFIKQHFNKSQIPNSNSNRNDTKINIDNGDENTISRDEAISDYWNEIHSYLSGTTYLEACYDYSKCYYLESDITRGYLETLYFPNGGNLNFTAEIDNEGEAEEYDENHKAWDFKLDMNSDIVDDAVNEWADSEGYIIE